MDAGRINPVNFGKVNTKIHKPKVKASKEPSDHFVKSTEEKPEPSMENVAGKFSAKNAGSMVLGDSKKVKAAFSGTVLEKKWSYDGSLSYRTPIIYNQKHRSIFAGIEEVPTTAQHKHYLTCLSPDGSVKWKYKDAEFRGGFTVDKDGNSYFGTMQSIEAVDKDGKKLWSVPINDQFYSNYEPVLADDGTLYTISPNDQEKHKHELTKLTAIKDGKVKWTYDLAGSWDRGDSSLMTGKDGTIYLAAQKDIVEEGMFSFMDKHHSENFLIALNPDGKEKFSIPVESWGKKNQGTLALGADGDVITIQKNRTLKAYTSDGKEKFTLDFEGPGYVQGQRFGYDTEYPPVVDKDGNIYFTGKNITGNALICLDKNGKEKWRHNSKVKFSVQPHIGPKGEVVIPKDDGNIYLLDNKGEITKKYFAGGNPVYRFGERVEDDSGYITDRIATDEKGNIYAATGNWVVAFDGNAEPMEQIENFKEDREAGQKTDDKSIKVEDKKVVIGGVELPVNKR